MCQPDPATITYAILMESLITQQNNRIVRHFGGLLAIWIGEVPQIVSLVKPLLFVDCLIGKTIFNTETSHQEGLKPFRIRVKVEMKTM